MGGGEREGGGGGRCERGRGGRGGIVKVFMDWYFGPMRRLGHSPYDEDNCFSILNIETDFDNSCLSIPSVSANVLCQDLGLTIYPKFCHFVHESFLRKRLATVLSDCSYVIY